MQRLIAAIILTSTFAFGLLHAAAGADFGHAAHGSMEKGFDCMSVTCPSTGSRGMQTMDCVTHCLAAAPAHIPSSPLATALLVFAFLLVLARQGSLSAVEDLTRRCTDVIGRLLLRSRLATVVLRN